MGEVLIAKDEDLSLDPQLGVGCTPSEGRAQTGRSWGLTGQTETISCRFSERS